MRRGNCTDTDDWYVQAKRQYHADTGRFCAKVGLLRDLHRKKHSCHHQLNSGRKTHRVPDEQQQPSIKREHKLYAPSGVVLEEGTLFVREALAVCCDPWAPACTPWQLTLLGVSCKASST